MIQAFVGLVGGGKSFNSVRRMMSYIAKGGTVCTNILLTGWDEAKQNFPDDGPVKLFLRSIGWEYQPGQYVYIPFDDMVNNPLWYQRIPAGRDREHRTLCVVDEATDLFDSLDGGKLKSEAGYRELFRFLRLSRHAHIDVLFICQDLQAINTRLKGLVSGIWRSTDMKGFKLKGIPIPFPLDTFLLQLFDRTGKNLIQREWVPKDKRVFTLYQSESFGGALGVKWNDSAIPHGQIEKKGRVMSWKEKLLVFGLIGLNLCVSVGALVSSVSTPPPATPTVVTNVVERVSEKADNLPSERVSRRKGKSLFGISDPSQDSVPPPQATNEYYTAPLRYHRTPYRTWADFGADLVVLGKPSRYGRVVHLDQDYILCERPDGGYTFLLPSSEPFQVASHNLNLSDSGNRQMESPLVHTKMTLP